VVAKFIERSPVRLVNFPEGRLEEVLAEPVESSKWPVFGCIELGSDGASRLFTPNAPKAHLFLGNVQLQIMVQKIGNLVEQRIGHPKGDLGLLNGKSKGRIVERVIQKDLAIGEMGTLGVNVLETEPPRRNELLLELIEEADQYRRFTDRHHKVGERQNVTGRNRVGSEMIQGIEK
jgi:hypothetical protein